MKSVKSNPNVRICIAFLQAEGFVSTNLNPQGRRGGKLTEKLTRREKMEKTLGGAQKSSVQLNQKQLDL